MELFIQILILFVTINTMLKLSFMKKWQIFVAAMVMGIFILFVYPFAVEQSKTALKNHVENPIILSDVSVLVTLESVFCISFCFMGFNSKTNSSKKLWNILLKIYPGLLIFPALFYLLTQTVFYFSGTDFFLIAVIFSVSVFVSIIAISIGIKYLIPEKEIRLETHLIVSLLVAVLGLIATNQGKITQVVHAENIDFYALGKTFILFLSLFLMGFAFNRFKWKMVKNNNK